MGPPKPGGDPEMGLSPHSYLDYCFSWGTMHEGGAPGRCPRPYLNLWDPGAARAPPPLSGGAPHKWPP